MTKSGAAGLYYKTLQKVASRMNLTEFQFNQVLASNPQAIRGGEFSISGIYTKKGYLNVILPNSKSILKEAIEANWVLNKEENYSDSEFKYLHKQILNLYFADYRKKWSRALAKISVPKYVDPKDLTEQLALFISEIWDDYSKKIAKRFPLDPKAKDAIEMEDFVAFFGRDGILDNFYKKNLFPFIQDINYQTKTYKISEIDGSTVTLDKALIESMFQAKAIQELMFDEGGVGLEIAFNLEPLKMSNNHSTMEVQYEDQLLLYEHGPKVKTKFLSPGASKESLAKFTLYDFELKRVVKVRGRDEWAMLRLLYKLNPKVTGKDVDGVKVKFSYKKNNNSGAFELKGKSSNIFSEDSPLLAFKLHKKGEE